MSDQSNLAGPGTMDVATATAGGVAEVHHPQPRQYVLIAVVLAVVTAIEVAISYLEDVDTDLLIVVLVALAAVKFFLVASWYMHLKFDQPMFRRLFVLGVTMAIVLYSVVLLTFSVFSV